MYRYIPLCKACVCLAECVDVFVLKYVTNVCVVLRYVVLGPLPQYGVRVCVLTVIITLLILCVMEG